MGCSQYTEFMEGTWTVTESGMDERKEGWEEVKEDGRSDGKKKKKDRKAEGESNRNIRGN